MNEQKILDAFNKNNPHPGIPFNNCKKYIDRKDGKRTLMFCLYSWLSGKSEDEYVSNRLIGGKLRSINPNFTLQLYIDAILLGITDISQRPKCPICGNPLEWEGKFRRDTSNGYKGADTSECMNQIRINNCMKANETGANLNEAWKSKITSKEYKENMSRIKKGTIFSDSHKKKIGSAIKNWRDNTEEGKAHVKLLADMASQRGINRALGTISSDLNRFGGKYKVGIYHSDIYNADFWHDSSWEKDFICYMEKFSIRKDVSVFEKSKHTISYKRSTDNGIHRYLPDFYIEFKNGLKVVIEIKPANIIKNDRVVTDKRIAAKKYFRKLGIKYVILSEKDLYRTRHNRTGKKDGKGLRTNFNIYNYIV